MPGAPMMILWAPVTLLQPGSWYCSQQVNMGNSTIQASDSALTNELHELAKNKTNILL